MTSTKTHYTYILIYTYFNQFKKYIPNYIDVGKMCHLFEKLISIAVL